MSDAEKHAPAGWLESLAISEAELAAGKTVLPGPIFQRLLESIKQFEAAQRQSPAERADAWRHAAEDLPETAPPLSDEAISRENIYGSDS